MYYHVWENGRIVRRRFPVLGEQIAAFAFGFTLTVLGALAAILVLS